MLVRSAVRTIRPTSVTGANPVWVARGLKSLYCLAPGIWDIEQVTGKRVGAIAGTGFSWTADGRLRTAGTALNGATLPHNLSVNIALPISIVAGWRHVSGAVTWSVLSTATANWDGWYSNGSGVINVAANNVFDGSVTVTNTGNIAFSHAGTNNLYAAGSGGTATDSAVSTPTLVDRTNVVLGWAAHGTNNDNAGVGEFSHFAVFQSALSIGECVALANNPWQLFKPLRIWVPVAAVASGAALQGRGTSAATGQATLTVTSNLTGTGNTPATGSGTLTVQAALASQASSTAAGQGTLTVQAQLTGTGNTQATGQATLTTGGSGAVLQSSASSSAYGQGTLTVQAQLQTLLAIAQAQASATLTVRSQLQGVGLVSASGSGVLSTVGALLVGTDGYRAAYAASHKAAYATARRVASAVTRRTASRP